MTSNIFEQIRTAYPLAQAAQDLGFMVRKSKMACPQHGDKTPSLHLYSDDTFHCFSCGWHGDVVTLCAHAWGMRVGEAAYKLADQLGIEYERWQPNPERAALYSLLNEATQWYQGQMTAPALFYLKQKRKLTQATLTAWGLGYAPASGGVLDHLTGLGATRKQLQEAGLISSRGAELFRNRIMFPIHDKQRRVVGFAGRAMSDEQQPKYLNTPTTSLFKKSHLLYGWSHYKSGDTMLVEGYMDVISLWQAGFTGVMGVMGTALTQGQIDSLGTVRLMLLLDGDAAGRRATKDALLKLKYTSDTHVATLPTGKDPDEFIRGGGQVEQLTSQPVHEWLIDAVQLPDGAREREALAQRLLPYVTHTGSPTLDQLNKAYLEKRFAVQKLRASSPSEEGEPSITPQIALERRCLAYLCCYEMAWCYINRYFDECELPFLDDYDFTLSEHKLLWQHMAGLGYLGTGSPTLSWIRQEEPSLEALITSLTSLCPELDEYKLFLELRAATCERLKLPQVLSRLLKLLKAPPEAFLPEALLTG